MTGKTDSMGSGIRETLCEVRILLDRRGMRGTWGKKSKFGRNTTGIQLECDRPATLLRSPEAVAGCSDLGVFHPKVSASWRTYLPRVLDRKADASSCGSRDQAFLNDGVEVWSAHIRLALYRGE